MKKPMHHWSGPSPVASAQLVTALRRWLAITLLAMLALPAAGAQAGEYTVSPCEKGRLDPATAILSAYVGGVVDRCKAQGTYGMDFGGHTLHRTFKGVDFTVPASAPNTSILGMSASVVMAYKSGANGSSGGIYYGDPTTTQMWPMYSPQGWTLWADYVDPQRGPLDVVVDIGTNVRLHRMMASCNEPCSFGAMADGSDVSLSNIRVRLWEGVAPQVVAFEPTGLLSPGAKSGMQELTFTAHDEDAGVQSATLKPTTGATVTTGGCGFATAAACPKDQTLRATIDTSKLSPGPQKLTATVVDAAGNTAEASTPLFTVAGPVVPVVQPTPTTDSGATGATAGTGGTGVLGSDSSPGAGGTALPVPRVINGTTPGVVTLAPLPKRKEVKRYSRTFGKQVSLEGRALHDGQPLANVQLDVLQTLDVPGAKPTLLATVTTDASGRYRYRLQATASATVSVAYPEHIGGGDYSAVRPVQVKVSAGVTLEANVKRIGRRKRVHFSGVVKIAPFPANGARVAIQVRSAYGWQDVAFLKTRPGGVFKWSHAFRTAGRFTFRAKVLGDKALGALPGNSSPLALTVR